MRPSFTRIIVAFACLIVGVFAGSFYHRVQPEPLTVTPPPVPTTQVIEENGYPDELGIDPFEIARFLRQHPGANLERLWQRLGITNDPDVGFNSDGASACEVNIFEYELDNDSTSETVLQIKQWGAYRYLIFGGADNEAKLIGHFDVYAKYTPADPVVFLSNGRAWLVVQETAATGTGLGAWTDTLYEVRNGRVRAVASFLSHVRESGDLGLPTKEFVARPLSCEIRDGRAVLTLIYKVEYTGFSTHEFPLFTKQQKAVLVSSLKDGSTSFDASRSEITAREFETIYNFDSESRQDFLRYNRSELRAIARGNNDEKKRWVKDFLASSGY